MRHIERGKKRVFFSSREKLYQVVLRARLEKSNYKTLLSTKMPFSWSKNELFCNLFCKLWKIFRASGHLERFSDWMVRDVKTGDCFRADHLIKNSIEKLLAVKFTFYLFFKFENFLMNNFLLLFKKNWKFGSGRHPNVCFQDKKTSADLKSELQEVLARLEGFDDKDMKEVIFFFIIFQKIQPFFTYHF